MIEQVKLQFLVSYDTFWSDPRPDWVNKLLDHGIIRHAPHGGLDVIGPNGHRWVVVPNNSWIVKYSNGKVRCLPYDHQDIIHPQ